MTQIPIETHPWGPFIPQGAKVVLMGTFPPAENRWAMRFYYPNRTNDFWRILSLIFLGDAEAFYDKTLRSFRVDDLKQLLTDHHIAIAATTIRVRRLKGNASDKDLEIVETVNLPSLLAQMPECQAIATTGEKAASVIAEITETPLPKIGEPIPLPLSYLTKHQLVNPTADTQIAAASNPTASAINIWRLPSTSRAYPLPLAKKAEAYATMFRSIGLL